ncbi:MAG: addiction module protein [Thermodesulfobacteriota bacterium]
MNLQKMTTKEKLMIMELLWDDLCKNKIDFSSPVWHEDILSQREKAISEGKDEFVDWTDAKKDILNLFS